MKLSPAGRSSHGYQDTAYARRYTDFVARVRTARSRSCRETALAEAVARYYFSCSPSNEYEVARLYTDGEFTKRVARSSRATTSSISTSRRR